MRLLFDHIIISLFVSFNFFFLNPLLGNCNLMKKKKLWLLLYVILFFVTKRRILNMDAKKTGLIIPSVFLRLLHSL